MWRRAVFGSWYILDLDGMHVTSAGSDGAKGASVK